MTREPIERIARRLTAGDPYYRRAFGTGQPSELERIDQVLSNPSFGSDAAFSYATAGMQLPNLEWPPAVRRAHDSWSHPDHVDDNLVLAESLNLPDNGYYRAVMHGLLLCEDGTDELIADYFQCDPEVGMLSSELFYNVRDRRCEPFYLQHLLREEHSLGQSLASRFQGLFRRDLLRLAVRKGKAQAVLAAAGIVNLSVPTEALIEQIIRELLVLAHAGLRKGLTSPQNNPALALALKHRLIPKHEDESVASDSLDMFQLNHADLQPLYDDLTRRLSLERGLVRDPAAANSTAA